MAPKHVTRLTIVTLLWPSMAGAALATEQAARNEVAGRLPGELRGQVDEAVGRGLEYLAATQRADGGWALRGQSDPAITALAGVEEPR